MLSPNIFSIKKCCETSRASVGLFLRVGGGKRLYFLFLLRFLILLRCVSGLRCLISLRV